MHIFHIFPVFAAVIHIMSLQHLAAKLTQVLSELSLVRMSKPCQPTHNYRLKKWNPGWNPKYFMTDFSLPEMNAILSVFACAMVLLCAFHRLQSIERWLSKSENGVTRAE